MVRTPRLPQEAFARVKAGLLRDLAIQKSTPQSIAGERFASLMYGDHPYGRLFPTEAMLGGYTLEQVQRFHRVQYGPNRARLYVAGVYDAPALEAAIRDAFGSWPRIEGSPAPARPTGPTVTGLRPHRSSRRAAVHGPPRDTRARPVEPRLDPLHRDERPARRLVRVAHHVEHPRAEGLRLLTLQLGERETSSTAHWVETADVTTANTGDSLKEIRSEIVRLRTEPQPAAELAGIQNNLAGTFVVSNASRGGVIGQLAFVDLHGLGDDYLAKYVDRVQAVTPEQVTAMARKYLDPEQMTLVVVGDEKVVKGQVDALIKMIRRCTMHTCLVARLLGLTECH